MGIDNKNIFYVKAYTSGHGRTHNRTLSRSVNRGPEGHRSRSRSRGRSDGMNSSEKSVSQTRSRSRSRSQSRSTSRSSGTYYRSISVGPSKLSTFKIDLGNCQINSFLLAWNNLYIYTVYMFILYLNYFKQFFYKLLVWRT
jgi:hypothetical protein